MNGFVVNMLLGVVFLLQIVGTPIADGTVVVSNGAAQYPDLPASTIPTPLNDDWELVYHEVVTVSNEYVIQGEMRNISGNPLETGTLIVTFANGGQMGIHPDVNQVGPGERAPFRSSVYDEDLIIAMNETPEVEITGICEYYGVIPLQDFTWDFKDVEIEYHAESSSIRTSGTVTNSGGTTAENFAPMLFGFTADGTYVGSIFARDVTEVILSGDEIEFEMDHGFDSFSSDQPFSGAGRDATFVLAMAPPVYISVGCV